MVFDAAICGLCAFVFISLLCQPGEVFGPWPPFLRSMVFGTRALVDLDLADYWQLLIYKPLAACAKCFAGWFSLATFLCVHGTPFFFDIVPFVSIAVFTAWLLDETKRKHFD